MEEILSKLSEEQAQFALEIVSKAKEMGIDPRLAVALAYRESGLNPKAKGTSGEIGLMQVMPSTAKGMGFTAEELNDPSKNIEIGLTYLKRGLEKFDGDPMLAAAGYNAGLDHPYFSDPENKPLPASTKEYLKGINNLGGFSATPETSASQEEGAPGTVNPPASEGDFQANKARIAADLIGAGAGAALSKGLDITQKVGQTGEAIRQLPGALAAAQASGIPSAAPGAPGAPGMPRPTVGGPAGPVGGPAGPLQQMGGPGAYNYGKAFGLTDIEAGRATDMSKAPGGASDLIAKRTEGLQKVQQMGGGYAENPRYGGIMTPQASVGGGPRASFVQAPGGMTQLPPTAPISSAPLPPPPGPGPLSQAAGALKQGAGAVLRSPIASGALGGLSMAESAQETQKRMGEGDTTGAAIATAGGIGGAMQLMPSPQLKMLGALVSAASPLTQYLRDNLKKQTEMPAPTEEELLMAEKPAFGFYPNLMRQAPARPRTFAPGENMPPVEFMR